MTTNPVLLAGLAGLFTWAMTALGSAAVFFFKEIKEKPLNMMMGFAAGVMVASSFWSLLSPAIEMSQGKSLPAWFPALTGFILGGLSLFLLDKFLPHVHPESGHEEGVHTSWKRSVKLVLAITIHNIPEGFAVGVAFGGLAAGSDLFSIPAAMSLALGIGLQNIPEGAAVSVPLRKENISRFKAFMYGQYSGMVEPLAAMLGAAIVVFIEPLLPYALSFAAGAMLYVVADELIPESQLGEPHEVEYSTFGFMGGFALMMLLDVALG